MPLVKVVQRDGAEVSIEAKEGDNLLSILHENNIDIGGSCRGALVCSQCHVVIEPKWYALLPDPTEREIDALDYISGDLTDTSRLACQVIITKELDGLEVSIPL